MNTRTIRWCVGAVSAWMCASAVSVTASEPDARQRTSAALAGGPLSAPVRLTAGPYWAPGGDATSGLRVGSPYYWSPQYGGSNYNYGAGSYSVPAYGQGAGYAPAYAAGGMGYAPGYSYAGGAAWGGAGGVASGEAYNYHFGPGFHRSADQAHYRFPYYSYRRPWYFPGPPSYNRDTNYPW